MAEAREALTFHERSIVWKAAPRADGALDPAPSTSASLPEDGRGGPAGAALSVRHPGLGRGSGVLRWHDDVVGRRGT
ncbi:MAG TPA: hypothetical protein VNG12_15200 [Acidimicrobiales bacterium]|nr:hypothetical protein [Acidimicrobiales bacterium]